MTAFEIPVEPPLPESSADFPDVYLDSFEIQKLDMGRLLAEHTQEHDLVYRTGTGVYGSYSASIITDPGDIHEEWKIGPRPRISRNDDLRLSRFAIGV